MSVFDWILYSIIAICVLMFMIMIHELGHYTAGKLLKFKINEFSIGFGKAIFSKKKKDGEVFSIRLVPLGGYCAFEGEDGEEEVEGAFNKQAPWKRLIVLFMGPFFNFLTALVFSVIFLMAFGYPDKVQVASVTYPTGVIQENWVQQGDVILAVNDTKTNLVHDEYFNTLIANFGVDENFDVTILRDGKEMKVKLHKSWMPLSSKVETKNEIETTYFALDGRNFNYRIESQDGKKVVVEKTQDGEKKYTVSEDNKVEINSKTYFVNTDTDGNFVLNSALVGLKTQNYKYGFFEALGHTFVFCFEWAWKILLILWQLLTGQMAIKNLGGTVTTVVTIAQATQQNLANLLLLVPLISVNLAVFNLLPFPALDGARMVFVAIEGIFRKPVPRKIEGMIHTIGLFVLLGFVLVVDILHFIL